MLSSLNSKGLRDTALTFLAIIVASGLVAIATFNYLRVQPTIYRATARLYAETSPLHPYGLTSGVAMYLPRLGKIFYQELATRQAIVQRTYQLAKLQNDQPAFTGLTKVEVNVGTDNYSDVVYLAVTDPDPQKALRISNGLAQAILEWNDQKIRGMASDYVVSLEAQLKTVSTSISGLNKTDPKNSDLPNLVNIRTGLLRDIQLMRGVAKAAKGNIKLLEPAKNASVIGLSPRYRAALAGMVTLLVLTFGWLSYRAWRQI